jgi:hypothetical protein
MNKRALSLTTINPPNAALRALAAGAVSTGCRFFIAGDVKSPKDFRLAGADYLSIEEQVARYPAFCEHLPLRHYTRKNVAYLAAIDSGANCLQETDDDNIPRSDFWEPFADNIPVELVRGSSHWVNVYALFSDEQIWPRGLPLEQITSANEVISRGQGTSPGLIRQGLADENPDVDAVYRMTCKLPVNFRSRPPIMIEPGFWCPFNSQNTVFRREVFPLLYLPSHCTFRMTDIWRSFVAQRCIWEMGQGLVFHDASVYQERNEHSLLSDFKDEVPGYLNNDRLVRSLADLALNSKDPLVNLVACYEHLVQAGFFPGEELTILRGWRSEFERMGG